MDMKLENVMVRGYDEEHQELAVWKVIDWNQLKDVGDLFDWPEGSNNYMAPGK